MTKSMRPIEDADKHHPARPPRRPMERTTTVSGCVIDCACCEWTAPIGHPDAHRLALRHAETNPGHLAEVHTSRTRSYIIRDA